MRPGDREHQPTPWMRRLVVDERTHSGAAGVVTVAKSWDRGTGDLCQYV